jgi:hypothetical protein
MSTPSLFPEDPRITLQVTLDFPKQRITFDWMPYQSDQKLAHAAVWVGGDGVLRWRITSEGTVDDFDCLVDLNGIHQALEHISRRFPVAKRDIAFFSRKFDPIRNQWERTPLPKTRRPWELLAVEVFYMGDELLSARSGFYPSDDLPPDAF